MNLSLLPNQSQPKLGDPYLRLQLDQQTAAILPMKFTQQVVVVPSRQVTPIPNMPNPVLGLLNQRSRVFWVVDLPQVLGLGSQNINSQQYNVVILQVGEASVGLVVNEVKGIARYTEDLIESHHGTVAANLVPYLQGCVMQPTGVLLVLHGEAILNSSILHSS